MGIADGINTDDPDNPDTDPVDDPLTFQIQYYSDPEYSLPLAEHPYVAQGTYYLKITASEDMTANPSISIDAEGTANDVFNADTIFLTSSTYTYERTISFEDQAFGQTQEDISINGKVPLNKMSNAAYTDTQPPIIDTGKFMINSGETYVNKQNVTLTINADDRNGSGPFGMLISNYSDFIGATWQSYELSYSDWMMLSGEGEKTVYIMCMDSVGNESLSYDTSVMLDTVSPVGTISINGGVPETSTLEVTLTLTSNDGSGSGISGMIVSNYNDFNDASWEEFLPSKGWLLESGGQGTREVHIMFKDLAGNESANYVASITYMPD